MGLPIRQNLDVLAGLNRTQRAVLTLVVELAENGGKGYCDATNDYLCKRTQATARTVTRTLAELQRLGLLAVGGHTTRRQITATSLLRPCYASGTKEACFAATISLGEALSIDKMAIEEPEMSIDNQGAAIDKPGQCLETNGALSIDIPCIPYKETSKDEYLDENNEKAKELALAQKKIAGLAFDLAEALEDLSACRATITDLRNQLENEKKKGGATRVATSVAALPYSSEEFAAKWQAFRISQGVAAGSARETALLATLQGVAATNEVMALSCLNKSIEMGWKSFYKPDESRNQPSQQSERGAKPTAAGATGARALAEQLALIDEQQRQERLHERGGGFATGAYTGQSIS
jgi:hypothetical protein